MKKILLVMLFFVFLPLPGYAAKVKIYNDESKTDFVMANKMDCRIHNSKRGITIGFKAGNLLFGVGPEVTFGGERGIRWEKTVQGIITRYKELCARFNTGTITQEEYEQRIGEIDAIAKEAMDFERNAVKRLKQRSNEAFSELDAELTKAPSVGYVDNGIEEIGRKVSGLAPIREMEEKSVRRDGLGIKVVIAEGIAPLGEDRSQSVARAMALNNARRSALERAEGVELRGSSVLYNSDLVSDLVYTATRGLIIGEDIIKSKTGLSVNNGQGIYHVTIRARVKPMNRLRKGNFKIISAELCRVGGRCASHQPVFQDGDAIDVKVKANEESYLSLFSVYGDGRVTKLYPNLYVRKALIPARQFFVFPDEGLRTMGISLEVATPKNIGKAVETVLVIATKAKPHFLEDIDENAATITDLMRQLSDIDSTYWAFKAVGYEVRR